MREAVAKRLPERRAEMAFRIAVQPAQLGRRVTITFVRHRQIRGDDRLRIVSVALGHRNEPSTATRRNSKACGDDASVRLVLLEQNDEWAVQRPLHDTGTISP